MRIVIDVQACQTQSRRRGIGRYSEDLTRALLDRAGDSELMLGLDGTYAEEMRQVVAGVGAGLPPGKLLRYCYPGPSRAHGDPEDGLRPAAEQLVRAAYASVSADVVHVNSLFEGYVEHAAGLDRVARLPGTISSVTLYDLIPLRFPETYLSDPSYAAWYRRKLDSLAHFDVLLCISEATRRDAVDLLGIPEDRLAVIGAGVGPMFRPAVDQDAIRAKIRTRFGIKGRFVLYTGNDDPRKNLKGAIRAFAEVPASARRNVQLVLNQVGDESAVRAVAKSAGLSRGDLVVTGWVPDDALVELLQTCDVFFFPSLYEGFGLPVVEAMACGAPAIASNNSSLPEIVGRSDALFDPVSPKDASRVLGKALVDDAFRASLVESGLARAKRFSWNASAELSMQAWRQAIARRDAEPKPAAGNGKVRLAMVTPIAPQETGIADYMSELLPEIARIADVEVFTTCDEPVGSDVVGATKFRHWSSLLQEASRFDQVVYQVGNSPFHSHMVDAIREVPGLVVLHDFFLSSMLWHKEAHEGCPGVFREALEYSHGVPALATYEADGENKLEVRREHPASRELIEAADGIIVHSAHSGDLCRRYFPGVRRGPWTMLPMPVKRRMPLGGDERSTMRRRLGVAGDELLVVSLGFMADTKLNLELLEALEHVCAGSRRRIRLVFVGGAAGGDYGAAVSAAIAAHPMRERIAITGFVSSEDYHAYLGTADCAVQLRTSSRGETSKAVLDCMAYGLPTVVNSYGAFAEMPEGTVLKVGPDADPRELAAALARLADDPDLRNTVSAECARYMEERHAPAAVAESYLDVVSTSLRWRHEASGDALAQSLAESVLAGKLRTHEVDAVEHGLSETVIAAGSARLLVDVSEVVGSDYGTGIHRVVRNFARELSLLPVADGPRAVLVAHDADGVSTSAAGWGAAALGLPVPGAGQARADAGVRPGDTLLLIDSAWQKPERFMRSIQSVRSAGGRAVAMVYDLIPLLYPRYCVDFMPAVFERWLRFVVANCDDLVCISRAVADDLEAWIRREQVPFRPALRIGHVPLGSDFKEAGGETHAPASPELSSFLERGGRITLMVGTVEPRKRHDLALQAFERLWAEGEEDRLLIIGRQGWNVEAFVNAVRTHPESGGRLGWLSSASDADISAAYAAAYRVLQASDAEGFGLPLVEAARHGCPLLVSDIPVFREVAGPNADYFAAGNLSSLVDGLRRPVRKGAGPVVETPSWTECAESLRALLSGTSWDHEL